VQTHVSPAIIRLTAGISIVSVVVGICLIVQMFVFAFVHYTDARFEASTAEKTPGALTVVPSSKTPRERGASWVPEKGSAGSNSDHPDEKAPRALSRWDGVLSQFSDTAGWIGTLSCLVLAVQLCLATVIAGGASIPGVEKIVSAANAGVVVAIVSLPLHDIFHSLPFIGAFSGYDAMTSASMRVQEAGSGEFGLLMNLAFIPLAGILALVWAGTKLRAGIASGVIIHSPSQLDERIDRELAQVRAGGVGSNVGPRTVGVLGHAMDTIHPSASDAEVQQALNDLGRPQSRRPI
jgi:hypothetical protein